MKIIYYEQDCIGNHISQKTGEQDASGEAVSKVTDMASLLFTPITGVFLYAKHPRLVWHNS